jgi:hypothetical protein
MSRARSPETTGRTISEIACFLFRLEFYLVLEQGSKGTCKKSAKSSTMVLIVLVHAAVAGARTGYLYGYLYKGTIGILAPFLPVPMKSEPDFEDPTISGP